MTGTSASRRRSVSAALDETTGTVVAERVRHADTFLTRLRGLLGSDGLAEGEALLISPCKGIHTIGMTFPIDAVFLDGERRVVAVRERVVPWRATRFIKGATSVLELPAGSVRKTRIAVGNQMDFVEGEDH